MKKTGKKNKNSLEVGDFVIVKDNGGHQFKARLVNINEKYCFVMERKNEVVEGVLLVYRKDIVSVMKDGRWKNYKEKSK